MGLGGPRRVGLQDTVSGAPNLGPDGGQPPERFPAGRGVVLARKDLEDACVGGRDGPIRGCSRSVMSNAGWIRSVTEASENCPDQGARRVVQSRTL